MFRTWYLNYLDWFDHRFGVVACNFYQVMSFSRIRSHTGRLRMGCCGKLMERLVLLRVSDFVICTAYAWTGDVRLLLVVVFVDFYYMILCVVGCSRSRWCRHWCKSFSWRRWRWGCWWPGCQGCWHRWHI